MAAARAGVAVSALHRRLGLGWFLVFGLAACGPVNGNGVGISTAAPSRTVQSTPPPQFRPGQTAVPTEAPGVAAVATEEIRPSPTPWFPLARYVAESRLPYDPAAAIPVVPVYACPEQRCLWLGDLAAGTAVTVTALSEDGRYCFVGGTVVQGWAVDGWVSCSRLVEEMAPAGP